MSNFDEIMVILQKELKELSELNKGKYDDRDTE